MIYPIKLEKRDPANSELFFIKIYHSNQNK